MNVFCAISKNHVHDPFFFEENAADDVCVQMLVIWLTDEVIANEYEDFIYQQDGTPPHWKLTVRCYLDGNQPGKEIERAVVKTMSC